MGSLRRFVAIAIVAAGALVVLAATAGVPLGGQPVDGLSWSASDPDSASEFAELAAERERSIAAAEASLGSGRSLWLVASAVGLGLGLVVGAGVAYRRQRRAIRRGREDV